MSNYILIELFFRSNLFVKDEFAFIVRSVSIDITRKEDTLAPLFDNLPRQIRQGIENVIGVVTFLPPTQQLFLLYRFILNILLVTFIVSILVQ